MSDTTPPLSLTAATSIERPIVERLLQLYLHDFSGFARADDPYGKVDGRGRFAYPHLDRYWQDSSSEPLLFRVGADLAGFALVNDWSVSGRGTDRAVAEFFVMRKYRRAGLGMRAALEIIQQRPVMWEISVADYNQPAQEFWSAVVASLRGFETHMLDGDGDRWAGPIWRLTPSVAKTAER